MLRWRLILGTLFIAALVGLFYFDARFGTEPAIGKRALPPGTLLLPIALLLAVAATKEYLNFVRTRDAGLAGRLLVAGNWLIVASPWLGAARGGIGTAILWQHWSFVGVVLALLVHEVFRYDKDLTKQATERIALGIFGLFYVGLLLSFVVRLRLSPYGIFPLVSLLVVVKLGDIGAYTVGRLFGRHKMAPQLSPGKTWEGLFGGLAFSVVGGYVAAVVGGIGSEGLPWFAIAVYSVVVCLTGVVGDLLESLLKRDVGRKDSSDWMPGFGGVLDLIDSPLLAAPVACWFWESGWLTGLSL